jgi:uncharacterized membrane protein
MPTSRMEAFSDGVIAILITIMVLELRIPHGTTWAALGDSLPALLTYVLSFIYLGIYWNNHHHMLHACRRVTGPILWANLHLLFWLSLVPFVTGWMGENPVAAVPSAIYGTVLFMAGVAYLVLQRAIIASQGRESVLKAAVGRDWKGKLSAVFYVTAIAAAFWAPWVSAGIYVLVALMWLIPDRRVQRALESQPAVT